MLYVLTNDVIYCDRICIYIFIQRSPDVIVMGMQLAHLQESAL